MEPINNTGDTRVNTELNLVVIYTVWHREHNRVARELHSINPHWSDNILYQEARKIIIAEIQHITYKHWLPIMLGNCNIFTFTCNFTSSF